MTDSSPSKIAAVVIGREQTGLGALRSLRSAGIPAYLACPAGDLATRSRWYRPTPGSIAWDGSLSQQTNAILEAMPLERAVLVPARDDAALWAAGIPHGPLAGRFLVSSSSRATLEILQDKARFGEFLAETSMPHPRTFTIRSSADIAAIPFDDLDRVFVKPANSQQFLQVTGVKGMWARNRAEFEAICKRLDGQNLAVIAQEYIPGNADDHYFLDGFRDRHGAITGLFARRRVRIYPPDFGSSSYCESIPLEEVADARTNLVGLLQQLQYRGIFSAEFKRDARDGVFRILEINTRAWWYVEFATRCGVNVCQMAYEDALDMPVTSLPSKYPVAVGCINLPKDLRAVFSRDGGGRVSRWRALRQWAHGQFTVFCFGDPLPGLFVAWDEIKQAVQDVPLLRGGR